MKEADAWIAWSGIAEPPDIAAGWLIGQLGAHEALAWVRKAETDPVGATHDLAPHADPPLVDAVIGAVSRWSPRLGAIDAVEIRRRTIASGARVVTREDRDWPQCLGDLAFAEPFALYVRGSGDLSALMSRCIAVVGSRSSTAYGDYVASSFAAEVSDAGWTVISGGAYGIDAAAHRAAIASGAATIAVMAGGIDRLYPVGNGDLLERACRSGAVFAEVPPGFAPHRARFLSRNRLIATAGVTVVVEAAARSGALNTARHALELGRPLAAVPGPVTSPSSAGCHGLIRDSQAVLVTTGADAIDLATPIGEYAVETGIRGTSGMEFADPRHRRVFDAIGSRGSLPSAIAREAGVGMGEVAAALGRLELDGLVNRVGQHWKRASTRERQ